MFAHSLHFRSFSASPHSLHRSTRLFAPSLDSFLRPTRPTRPACPQVFRLPSRLQLSLHLCAQKVKLFY